MRPSDLFFIAMLFAFAAGCSTPAEKPPECAEDTDCPLGEVCQEREKQCIVAACDFCTDGQICYRPTPEAEGSCSAPPDCADGDCPDGGTIDGPDMSEPAQDTGPAGPACAILGREAVDFGLVGIGETRSELVRIENCAESGALEVQVAELGSFKTLPIPPISPGESADIEVQFAPESAGAFAVELELPTSAGRFVVAAKGTGAPQDEICPTPVILAGSGVLTPATTHTATLDAVVELSASSSIAQQGQVEAYEWSVVERPPGSTSMLSDSAAVAPTLVLDTLGEYAVDLSVTDSFGVPACAPSRVRLLAVEVIPPRFRITLTWDTPSDPDQTDINGTDLDLHYLGPAGQWNAAPFDIFWNNVTADWMGEDPLLTIDDTDGAGPEEIEHDAAVDDSNYRLGAYYYNDRGFGTSYATLSVYVDGLLTFEYRDNFMPATGVFWGGFILNGLTGGVDDVAVVQQQGFPQ